MRALLSAALATVIACAPAGSLASPTPTASMDATGTPGPSSTRAPIPAAGPGTYTSVDFAYRLELPAGWRYSQCQSGPDISQTPTAHEIFTTAGVEDEAVTSTGPAQASLLVHVTDEPRGRAPLQWLSEGGVGFSTDTFEPATVDGRDGARVVTTTGEIKTLVTYARGRIYAITAIGPSGILPADSARIMSTLHVLDDTELTAARATLATPSPAAARSAEAVADTLERGFRQRDTSVLATVSWPCLTRALQDSGGSMASATRVLGDLRTLFAADLTVTIAPRPVNTQAGGYGSVEATWSEAGQAPRRAAMSLLQRGDTWYWAGWIDFRR